MSETSTNGYLTVYRTDISVRAAIVGDGIETKLFELPPADCITEKTAAMNAIGWFLKEVHEHGWSSARLRMDPGIGIPEMAITVKDGITLRILPASTEGGGHSFDSAMAAGARRIAGMPEPPAREVHP